MASHGKPRCILSQKCPASAKVHVSTRAGKGNFHHKEIQHSLYYSRHRGLQHQLQDTHTFNSCQPLLEVLLQRMVLTCLKSRFNRI